MVPGIGTKASLGVRGTWPSRGLVGSAARVVVGGTAAGGVGSKLTRTYESRMSEPGAENSMKLEATVR
jgi:hypothetical protein